MASTLGAVVRSRAFEERVCTLGEIVDVEHGGRLSCRRGRVVPPLAGVLQHAGDSLRHFLVVLLMHASVAGHPAHARGADSRERLDAGVGLCGVRGVSA